MAAAPEIADIYLAARDRIDDLVRSCDGAALATPVPACPGWSVRDVVGHLAVTVAWHEQGRLRGIPSDEDTAQQVAEAADVPVEDLLDRWTRGAPAFAAAVAGRGIWPAAIDVVTHEHDIRHALGTPGARDDRAVGILADVLVTSWTPSRPVEVVRGDRVVRIGPPEGEPLRWRTDDFEAFRARMGRRSRAQLSRLDWSADPGPVLDEVAVFGPTAVDIDG